MIRRLLSSEWRGKCLLKNMSKNSETRRRNSIKKIVKWFELTVILLAVPNSSSTWLAVGAWESFFGRYLYIVYLAIVRWIGYKKSMKTEGPRFGTREWVNIISPFSLIVSRSLRAAFSWNVECNYSDDIGSFDCDALIVSAQCNRNNCCWT